MKIKPKRGRQSLEELRRNESKIKDEFKDKLKAWGRQKHQLEVKKHLVEKKKAQQKAAQELRQKEEAEQARAFEKERKKKQLEQKISDI